MQWLWVFCLLACVFTLGCQGLADSFDTEGEFLRQIMCLLILVRTGKNSSGKAAAYLLLTPLGVNVMGIPLHPLKTGLAQNLNVSVASLAFLVVRIYSYSPVGISR